VSGVRFQEVAVLKTETCKISVAVS
jgi:hypothetical protein